MSDQSNDVANPNQGGARSVIFRERVTAGRDAGVYLQPESTDDDNRGILGNRLNPGSKILPNYQLRAESGPYYLNLSTDGRFTLRAFWDERRWWQHGGIAVAAMEEDGNFALYDDNGATVWESGTAGNPGAYLRLRDDGNLVLVHPNKGLLWESDTALSIDKPEDELVRRILWWKLQNPLGLYNKASWTYERLDLMIDYESLEPTRTDPQLLDQKSYSHCGSMATEHRFNFEEVTKNSASWTNTKTWKVDAKFSIKVPLLNWLVASGPEISGGYQVTNTEGGSEGVEVTRSESITVTVPPQTRMEMTWILEDLIFESPFTYRIVPIGAIVTARSPVGSIVGEYHVDDYLTTEEKTIYGSGLFNAIVGSRQEIRQKESPADCS